MIGAILGTAAKIGGTIYGAVASSQANKKAQSLISAQRDENKKWYEEKMAEDYLQRSDIQNVLRKQRDLLGEQMKRARATNIVAGGTDESLALQQQGAIDTLGETTANVAANATAAKDAAEQQYRAQDAALNQQQIGLYQQQAKDIATAAGQIGKSVSGLVSGGASETTGTGEADVTNAPEVEQKKR